MCERQPLGDLHSLRRAGFGSVEGIRLVVVGVMNRGNGGEVELAYVRSGAGDRCREGVVVATLVPQPIRRNTPSRAISLITAGYSPGMSASCAWIVAPLARGRSRS